MAKVLPMPKLGVTMDEGKIVEWKKQEGNAVKKGELLVIIETDKLALEYESPESGILTKIYANPGDTIVVGKPLCLFAEPGEKLEPAPQPGKEIQPVAVAQKEIPPFPPIVAVSGAEPGQQMKVVPLVRKLADELGIPLQEVKGTGPQGRVTKDDLLKYAEERKRLEMKKEALLEKIPVPPGGGERRVRTIIPLSGMRGTIAKRMAASFQNPQGSQFLDIDTTETLALRDLVKAGIEKQTGERFTFTALLVKTLTQALLEHPIMNSIIEDGQIKIIENINIGVAAALEEGLIVPVLHDAQNKSLGQIVSELAALTEKARDKKLTPADVSAGTFTITNMGMYGTQYFTPLLNPPEAAIMGVGTIQKKPVVIGDEIKVRPILPLSLTVDHRAVDGAPAAQFFARLKAMLETPYPERISDIVF